MPTTCPTASPLSIFGPSYGPGSRTRQPPAWFARWKKFVVSFKVKNFLFRNKLLEMKLILNLNCFRGP